MSTLAVSPGLAPASAIQLLHVLRGANLQSVADQPFTRVLSGTSYMLTSCVARQRSGGASVLCAGGIYTGAGKTGDILVLAATSWITLAAGVIVNPSLASLNGTNLETATPILSLTTGSTAACTCDIYLFGIDLT